MLQLAAVFSDHMVLQREKKYCCFRHRRSRCNYHRFHSGTKIICFYHRKRRRQLAAAISAAACWNRAQPIRKKIAIQKFIFRMLPSGKSGWLADNPIWNFR